MLPSLHAILRKAHEPRWSVAVCAHRGNSSEAPENTLAAFESAVSLGVDLVELDVRLTRDKRLMVFHNERLGRTTNGSGMIEEHTCADLKKLDAGSWFDQKFAGERIPTLEEALDVIGPKCTTLIEIKVKKGYYEPHEMAEAVLKIVVGSSSVRSRVILQSFDVDILREIRRLDKLLPLALLTSVPFSSSLDEFEDIELAGVNPEFRLATEHHVVFLHNRGLWTLPWTVDSADEMRELINAGVDGLITNRPRTMLKLLKEEQVS